MTYNTDIFYKTFNLSIEQKTNILLEAKEKSYEWWVDTLEPSKSFSRKRININFEEILSKLDNNSHFVFINRKGSYEEFYNLEIGFSSLENNINYFLWIYLYESEIDFFVKKYNLEIYE